MFVNPPEVNMMWPDVLGGGYHYLMLNGKWKTPENNEKFMWNHKIYRKISLTNRIHLILKRNHFL